MLPFGGAVAVSTPAPAVNDNSTRRCSMSNACVGAPGRTSTTWEMFAASGVWISNVVPYEKGPGLTPLMVGLTAGVPLPLNKYAGE